ncbi:MAG: alpha/beta fold hydrolase [Sphingobium sp.]
MIPSNDKAEGGRSPQGVVLLHGFGGLPIQTALLAARLRRAGFAVLNPFYPSWQASLPEIVDRLQPRIARFAAQFDTIHGVGHSMGGLVLRAAFARDRPTNLGHVVTLGTPHGGSELADLIHRVGLHRLILNRAAPALRTARDSQIDAWLGPIDYPLGVIAGNRPEMRLLTDAVFRAPHDGKVSVAATHVIGQKDHIVMPVTHVAMLHDGQVAHQAIHFLQRARFERPG